MEKAFSKSYLSLRPLFPSLSSTCYLRQQNHNLGAHGRQRNCLLNQKVLTCNCNICKGTGVTQLLSAAKLNYTFLFP